MHSVQRHVPGNTSCRSVLLKLPQNAEILDKRTVYAIFQNLQTVNSVTEDDIQHPKFQSLIKRTVSLIPQMTAAELSNITIGIIYHKALQQNEINGEIQDALLPKMHELPFDRMLFLDYIMHKTKSTNSFETIQRKGQGVFLENVGSFFTNHSNNIQTFANVADYMRKHVKSIPSPPHILEQFSNALIALLHTDENRMNIQNIVQIIRLYSNFGELDGQSVQVLNKIVKLWIELNPTLTDVQLLLFLLSGGGSKPDKKAFEESNLIPFIFNFLDENFDEENLPCYEHMMKMVIKAYVIDE